MSTLTVTNPTLSDPASKTEVEQNFSDVESWANGGIGNDNISANAGIALTKLAASKEHIALQFVNIDLTAAASATVPRALIPVPGLSTDAAWTVDRIEWTINDYGAGTADFRVGYGYFTGVDTNGS